MEGISNDPSPGQGEKKIEEEVKKSYDQLYADILKKDQEADDAKKRGDATLEFDKVRKLGFATSKDIDDRIEAVFGKMIQKIDNLENDNTKLREWVMRAKAQGLNTGKLEENTQENELLKSWERPFMKDLKK